MPVDDCHWLRSSVVVRELVRVVVVDRDHQLSSFADVFWGKGGGANPFTMLVGPAAALRCCITRISPLASGSSVFEAIHDCNHMAVRQPELARGTSHGTMAVAAALVVHYLGYRVVDETRKRVPKLKRQCHPFSWRKSKQLG